MLFDRRRDKAAEVLRKALRTKDLRDREALISHARELNEIAMEASGAARVPTPRARPSTPVTPELEAVARRMCLAFHLDWRGDAPTRWSSLVDEQWPDFLVEAQAAIEALMAVADDPDVRAYLSRAATAPARQSARNPG